jgi:hypothetical protein
VGRPGVNRLIGMRYQVTVRHGGRRQRYHTYAVDAADAAAALEAAAEQMPLEIRGDADLVELRPAADADSRVYLEE